ncbi:MAG: acyl-CoA dehydrogenase family protein [Planctomycetaceae bacterium]|nr:acyl-CoA dehydrogenase family protein [Planctomycetaceae bacterium]
MSSTTPTTTDIDRARLPELLPLCRKLAAQFAPRAAAYDREGRFPTEDFGEMRAAGLMGILVPQSHGGTGANYADYTRAIEALAIGNGATALAFNMHNVVVGALAELDMEDVPGRRAQSLAACRNWIYDEALAGKVFASASSEPEAGPRLTQIKTKYERVDGGFILEGTKSFVSMAGHADYYLIAARSEQMFGDVPGISYFIVERDNPDVTIREVWDTLGMRATCSNTLILNRCFVPTERLFLLEGVALYKSTREPHWLIGGFNGVYLGIAVAAFEFLTSYLQRQAGNPNSPRRIDDPLVQHRVGELAVALESTRNVVYDAAERVVRDRGSLATNIAIHRAKYLVNELGPRLSSEAISLCGGSTIAKRFPLERYYRDSRCGGLMPARSDDCLTYIGRAVLGIDVTNPLTSYW